MSINSHLEIWKLTSFKQPSWNNDGRYHFVYILGIGAIKTNRERNYHTKSMEKHKQLQNPTNKY